jgi:hypothetical protein
VQLRPPQPNRDEGLPQPAGFTLVEEDDVAFTLSLCREVHRIYGRYQEAAQPGSEPLQAGLVLTIEMLAVLSLRIETGMPAMRITVAAAQTREMLAVLFGLDPMHHPVGASFRERYLRILADASPVPPAAIGPVAFPPGRRHGRSPFPRILPWGRRR